MAEWYRAGPLTPPHGSVRVPCPIPVLVRGGFLHPASGVEFLSFYLAYFCSAPGMTFFGRSGAFSFDIFFLFWHGMFRFSPCIILWGALSSSGLILAAGGHPFGMIQRFKLTGYIHSGSKRSWRRRRPDVARRGVMRGGDGAEGVRQREGSGQAGRQRVN